MLRGRACVRNESGTVTSTLSNTRVLENLGFAPLHIEIAILRLQWLADMCRKPTHHELLFAIMFGDLINVSGSQCQHPHLVQLKMTLS